MMQAVVAVVALVVGILLGFWFRGHAAKSEKTLAKAEKDMLEQRNREAAETLAAAQAALARTRPNPPPAPALNPSPRSAKKQSAHSRSRRIASRRSCAPKAMSSAKPLAPSPS